MNQIMGKNPKNMNLFFPKIKKRLKKNIILINRKNFFFFIIEIKIIFLIFLYLNNDVTFKNSK